MNLVAKKVPDSKWEPGIGILLILYGLPFLPLFMLWTNRVFLFVLRISFLVLIERYILRSSQSRVRCRNTGYFRLIQTLVDRRKLFLKTEGLGQFFCGLVFFIFALLSISYSSSYLILLVFLGFLSLSLLVATFTSNNSFALVSFLRVVLVSISFDVVMCFYLLVGIYSVSSVFVSRVLIFISFCLMELGRTPYDLLERESELVSRYNIEFGGFGFTLLFLGEYSGFFWILGLFSFLFGCGFLFGTCLFLFLVTIRAVLPRLKFVQVIKLSWRVLNLFIFILIRVFS